MYCGFLRLRVVTRAPDNERIFVAAPQASSLHPAPVVARDCRLRYNLGLQVHWPCTRLVLLFLLSMSLLWKVAKAVKRGLVIRGHRFSRDSRTDPCHLWTFAIYHHHKLCYQALRRHRARKLSQRMPCEKQAYSTVMLKCEISQTSQAGARVHPRFGRTDLAQWTLSRSNPQHQAVKQW